MATRREIERHRRVYANAIERHARAVENAIARGTEYIGHKPRRAFDTHPSPASWRHTHRTHDHKPIRIGVRVRIDEALLLAAVERHARTLVGSHA